VRGLWGVLLFCSFWLLPGCSQEATVLSIVFNPQNSDILYVGTTGGGFHKSVDGGQTFLRMTNGLSRYNVTAIAAHPLVSSILYAGTYGDSLYRSIDGGRYWAHWSSGLDDNVGTQAVNAVVIDPQTPDVLYIATNHGVYKSDDGGSRWQATNMGIGNRFGLALVSHPKDGRIWVVGTHEGIYQTYDAATRWTLTSPQSREWATHTLLWSQENHLYAGTDHGIFMGNLAVRPVKWENRSRNLSSSFVMALVSDGKPPETLWAGGAGGIDVSEDGGASWRPLPGAPRAVSSLAIDPKNGNVLFAGTASGLHQSRNRGKVWARKTLGE
jgi:photosystem II stability/assembly factor-like uncharacterized protein